MAERNSSTKFRDRTGDKYGRLVAMKYMGNQKWHCRCDCGKDVIVKGCNLTSGNSKSCGCLNRDIVAQRSTTHGHTRGGKGTREYRQWYHMIGRCVHEKDKDYPSYGGRGIRVCERWRNSFEAFLEDMGERPGPGYSIDRIDNDGDYEPGNCRWATSRQQANNRRNTISLTIDGELRRLTEWASISGIPYGVILQRLRYLNWPAKKAVFHPVQNRFGRIS